MDYNPPDLKFGNITIAFKSGKHSECYFYNCLTKGQQETLSALIMNTREEINS